MLPLELLLRLLQDMREEVIERAENPQGRDAFAFGETAGMFRSIREMHGRVMAEVNKTVDGDDSE